MQFLKQELEAEVLNRILHRENFHDQKCSNLSDWTPLHSNLSISHIFLFGSHLYECNNENSDFDFIILVDGSRPFDGSIGLEFVHRQVSVNVMLYHVHYFTHALGNHMHYLWVISCLLM